VKKALVVLVSVLWLTLPLAAAEDAVSCAQVSAMARMATARSMAALNAARVQTGNDLRAQLVFAVSCFRIKRDHSSAVALLELLPVYNGDPVAPPVAASTLNTYLCDDETDQQFKVLATLAFRIPRYASLAVLNASELMPRYVQYVMQAVGDPDNEITMEMRRVCYRRNPELTRAINALPKRDHEWFRSEIMKPESCVPIHMAEQ
jgi:hypothetical protein